MLTTSPAVSRTLRYLAGIQDDEPQPAPAQPTFAPEDYSSSVIAPQAPVAAPPVRDDYRVPAPPPVPTFAAPFQDETPTPEPPPPPPPPRPQYTGPSYGQRPLQPGEQSTLQQVSNVVAGAGRGLVEGAQAGLAAADQALTGPTVTPPTWEDPLAPVRDVGQHIAQHPLSVLPLGIYGEVQSAATDPIGRRAVEAAGGGTDPLFEATVPESVPFVGGARIAPSAQDVGGMVAQTVLDPLNFIGAAGAGLAGRGVRHVAAEAARGLPLVGESEALLRGGAAVGRAAAAPFRGMQSPVAGIRGAVAGNAERMAAADARMAAQGSTAAPGVFGLSGIEPDQPAVRGLRPRIIPEDVADQLDYPITPPTDPAVIRAIKAAGGTVDERGTTLNVIRMSDPEAAGGAATRSMVFYTAGPPGAPSEYARTGTVGPQGVGGQQRIEGRTRFRNPLFISDAPGEARGFDDAVRQMGVSMPASAEEVATVQRWLSGAREQLESARRGGSPDDVWRIEGIVRGHERDLVDLQQPRPISASEVEDGIRAAKRAGPAGSAARAQALKDLVSKYGGDPDVIDDLIELRGETLGESVYAVKENIVAGNARRAGHDGVITINPREALWDDVLAHPAVKAAHDAEQAALTAQVAAQRAHTAHPTAENWRAFQRAEAEQERATAASKAAWEQAQQDLRSGEITELADPREARNPTPGARDTARIEQVRQGLEAAQDRESDIQRALDAEFRRQAPGAEPSPEWQRLAAERDAAHEAVYRWYDELTTAQQAPPSPPGYTLRPDIPARAGTPEAARRAAEAAEEAAHQARLDAAFNHPDVQAAGQRVHAAEEAYQAARARWQAGDMADRSELDAAFDARGQALAEHARLQREAFQAGSTTAQASAGALPAEQGPRIGADRLSTVNRALSQGVVSSVSGGVGAQVNQEMHPDDPYAAAKGFAVGALAPPLLARGGRAAARLAGKDVRAEGALIGLGDVPPSKLREPTLPGVEPPHRPYEQVGPHVQSDQPNAPGNRLGNVPPSAIRRPGLPDFEEGPPRPISEAAADLALSPEQRTGIGPLPENRALPVGQTLEQALPDILHALNPPRSAREAAQAASALPTLAAPTGPIRRLAGAISDLVSPVVDKANAVRYAGMLSDAAGHAFNAASNALLQGVDVVTGPIAAGLDVGRTTLGRTGLPYLRDLGTDRQVWLSEVGPRVTGMRTGAKVGLQAAADVLRTGVSPAEAGKMDVARPGFGTNIPGVAPAGGRVAAVADFAMEAPLRAMAAADAAFRTSSQGGHLMAEAYAAARQANGGRPPTTAMIREAAKRDDVVERAMELAKRSVLQEDRAVTQAYQQFLQKTGPFGQAVSLEVPFVKTPYNVVAQGMGMTPAGLAQTYVDVKAGKSARHVEQQLARVALGTAVMGVAFSDYSMGNLTGGYPTDEKTASTLPPGWRPWSRKVEALGGTYYLPLSMLGPLALPAVVAILANQAQKEGNAPLSPAGAGAIARGVGAYAVQSSFFGGLVELSKLFDLRTSEPDFERQAERLVAQFSPHILLGGGLGRSLQRVMGMPARDPEGVQEAMLATFPYTAGQVAPAQDVLGRPRSQGASGPASLVIRAGEERDAPVLRAFRRAGEGLPMAAPTQIRDPDTGRDRTLTPPQRHRWRSAFGAELQAGWNAEGRPPDAAALQKIEAAAREAATQQALGRR